MTQTSIRITMSVLIKSRRRKAKDLSSSEEEALASMKARRGDVQVAGRNLIYLIYAYACLCHAMPIMGAAYVFV